MSLFIMDETTKQDDITSNICSYESVVNQVCSKSVVVQLW